jgi:hypothetical protein
VSAMTTATASPQAWAPRSPKSALRLWTRYCAQWVWGPVFWVVLRLPLVLLALLDMDVQGQSSNGGTLNGKSRWRRRIWIDRERLSFERMTDPQEQEQALRQLLEMHRLKCVPQHAGEPPLKSCAGGRHQLNLIDSHYWLIGAWRALEIAQNEFNWTPTEEVGARLPGWLLLRCPPVSQLIPVPVGKHDIRVQHHQILGKGPDHTFLPSAQVFVQPGTSLNSGRRVPRPPFSIHGGPDRLLLCSVQPVGQNTYDIHADGGAPLARISRRPGRWLLGPRRVQWSIQPSYGQPPVTGKVGTGPAWVWYYLFSPAVALWWLFLKLCSGLTGGAGVKGPRRTRWGGPDSVCVMDSDGGSYRIAPERLDLRVSYAQAALHAWDIPS